MNVSHCILLAKTVLKDFGRNTVCNNSDTKCCDEVFDYKTIHSIDKKYAVGLIVFCN